MMTLISLFTVGFMARHTEMINIVIGCLFGVIGFVLIVGGTTIGTVTVLIKIKRKGNKLLILVILLVFS